MAHTEQPLAYILTICAKYNGLSGNTDSYNTGFNHRTIEEQLSKGVMKCVLKYATLPFVPFLSNREKLNLVFQPINYYTLLLQTCELVIVVPLCNDCRVYCAASHTCVTP